MAEVNLGDMISVIMEDMVDINMEEMTDVNLEDMAQLNLPLTSEVNVDDLMEDVTEVQSILQCNNVGHMIDVNEIYEKLEELTYIGREKRIEYVATQLLHKSGIIVESNIAPEERVFRFSVQSNEENLVENSNGSYQVESVPSGSIGAQNDLAFSNKIASGQNYDVVNPHELCQNVSRPVTTSQLVVRNQNSLDAKEIPSACCQEFNTNTEILMEEAKIIFSILPHHDFEHIYACLEANKNDNIRVDIVTEMLLQIDAEREVVQMSCAEATVINSMNTNFVKVVEPNPVSMCATCVFPFNTLHDENVCQIRTASDDKLHSSNKYSANIRDMHLQKSSAGSEFNNGNFHISEEISDREIYQDTNRSIVDEQVHGNDIEKTHKIVTEKLQMERQHNEQKVSEKSDKVAPSSPAEHEISEEIVEVLQSFSEHEASERNLQSTPSAEFTQGTAPVAVKGGDIDLVELAASQHTENDLIDFNISDIEWEDTPSYSSCKELDIGAGNIKEESALTFQDEFIKKDCLPLSDTANKLLESESQQAGELAASQHIENDLIDFNISDIEWEDTPSYSSCKELDIGAANIKEESALTFRDEFNKKDYDCLPLSDTANKLLESESQQAGELPLCYVSVENRCRNEGPSDPKEIVESHSLLEITSCEELQSLPSDTSVVSFRLGSFAQQDFIATEIQEDATYVDTDFCHRIDIEDIDVVHHDDACPKTDCETAEIHSSCNVQSQDTFETSALSSCSENSINLDFSILQKTNVVEFNDSGEVNGIITDLRNTLPESETDTTEIFENRSRLHMLTNVTEVQESGDQNAVAEAEEQCNMSVGSANSVNFVDLLDELNECEIDKNVAKLLELFPDASRDYLIEVSLQFDCLVDMANRVLECNGCEQNDDTGETLSEAMPSTSMSVPHPSSQGCRRKEITYDEFMSSLPHVDPVFLQETWERIGTNYGAVKEFIAQQMQETSSNNHYHTLLSLFPQADPAFLRDKCNVIGDNEAALKDFIEEQLQDKPDTQYNLLLAMFPQADSAYLREKCIEIGNDETAMRAFVVEQLKMNEGDDRYHTLLAMLPDIDPAFLREAIERVGDDEDAMKLFVTEQLEEMDGVKFQTLLAVLPDADPDYLHATFGRIGNDEEAVKVFLLEALENKNYPTREAYLKRQEMATLQRKYKEEFSIEDFLEMIPDPWKHFYQKNKNSNSVLIRNHGIAYLETRYRSISLEELTRSFQMSKHNLTLTCRELDNWKGPLQPPRETFNCTIPDPDNISVPFLQEVAFIENEQRIQNFIAMKEQQKKEDFEMAKTNGELLECLCCYDSEVMADDMAPCNDGHLFCKDCIKRSAEFAIGNAQSSFSCLTNCSAEFSLKVLRGVLKPTAFSRMVQRKQLEEVQAAGIQDLESCPFCDFATIPPSDDKVFLCFNPDCMRDSCRKCKRPNHIPLRCDEVESQEVKMRTFIEDRMTDALVRTCWKCKKKFIKEAGCNKMTCTCGAFMCYICRQPVTDYSHFNGQGGTEFHKCPLYSDLEVIHDVAVQEEGMKAKKEAKARNPDVELRYDPTETVPLGGP